MPGLDPGSAATSAFNNSSQSEPFGAAVDFQTRKSNKEQSEVVALFERRVLIERYG